MKKQSRCKLFQNQLRPLPRTLRLEPSLKLLSERNSQFQVNIEVQIISTNKFKSTVELQIGMVDRNGLIYSI